ncbi:toxin-antitoxin system YwqK family antitoxin [Psychroflexus montanilacus]|uniref:toxin-antitoxin system YwqK family antitoxin n=1 Tax=Psychroflexus montanilacus TaxID=2873598 RepID=UPI001CCEC31A|nr:hypothetical protein [Psychroflexus montanilacus]MBZ9652364.1 hypothetical protein [Psychroflexus montanilacus]
MKAFSTLVMVFLMSFTLFAQTENNLVKTEKVGDLEKVMIYYESGELHQIGFIKNDKLHGDWQSFDKDGNKTVEATYNKGMKVGKWTFWNNGEKTEVNYNNSRIAEVKVTQNGKTEVVSN